MMTQDFRDHLGPFHMTPPTIGGLYWIQIKKSNRDLDRKKAWGFKEGIRLQGNRWENVISFEPVWTFHYKGQVQNDYSLQQLNGHRREPYCGHPACDIVVLCRTVERPRS